MTTLTENPYHAQIAEFDAGIAEASAWLADHPEANDFFRNEMSDVLRNIIALRKRAVSFAAELELRSKIMARWVGRSATLEQVATREEMRQLAIYDEQSDLDQVLM